MALAMDSLSKYVVTGLDMKMPNSSMNWTQVRDFLNSEIN